MALTRVDHDRVVSMVDALLAAVVTGTLPGGAGYDSVTLALVRPGDRVPVDSGGGTVVASVKYWLDFAGLERNRRAGETDKVGLTLTLSCTIPGRVLTRPQTVGVGRRVMGVLLRTVVAGVSETASHDAANKHDVTFGPASWAQEDDPQGGPGASAGSTGAVLSGRVTVQGLAQAW